jgi:hypothetical protein
LLNAIARPRYFRLSEMHFLTDAVRAAPDNFSCAARSSQLASRPAASITQRLVKLVLAAPDSCLSLA